MLTCCVCGEKYEWFYGGPETIKYPMTINCPTCGAPNIDPGPPNWQQINYLYEPLKLEQDWDK